MEVKVVLKRRVKKSVRDQLEPLLVKLRQMAMSQPGYISGQTLINIEDSNDFIVISSWQSIDDWNRWLESDERKEVQIQVDYLLFGDTEYEIYKNH